MTAVKWLIDQLDIITRDTNKYDDFKWIFEYEIEQAKEMEKQQIIDAWDNRNKDVIKSDGKTAEQYYNETFKKN